MQRVSLQSRNKPLELVFSRPASSLLSPRSTPPITITEDAAKTQIRTIAEGGGGDTDAIGECDFIFCSVREHYISSQFVTSSNICFLRHTHRKGADLFIADPSHEQSAVDDEEEEGTSGKSHSS